jgi:hypothetical protein
MLEKSLVSFGNEMPYKSSGKNVYVKKRGRWVKKATAKTTSAAKRMVKLLRGVKAGTLKRKRKTSKK